MSSVPTVFGFLLAVCFFIPWFGYIVFVLFLFFFFHVALIMPAFVSFLSAHKNKTLTKV